MCSLDGRYTTLPAILESPTLLKPCMDFMKTQNAVELLMFIMDVKDFRNDMDVQWEDKQVVEKRRIRAK